MHVVSVHRLVCASIGGQPSWSYRHTVEAAVGICPQQASATGRLCFAHSTAAVLHMGALHAGSAVCQQSQRCNCCQQCNTATSVPLSSAREVGLHISCAEHSDAEHHASVGHCRKAPCISNIWPQKHTATATCGHTYPLCRITAAILRGCCGGFCTVVHDGKACMLQPP
jgi:hypothetical protein